MLAGVSVLLEFMVVWQALAPASVRTTEVRSHRCASFGIVGKLIVGALAQLKTLGDLRLSKYGKENRVT
jgi:uncharacterized membrane protein